MAGVGESPPRGTRGVNLPAGGAAPDPPPAVRGHRGPGVRKPVPRQGEPGDLAVPRVWDGARARPLWVPGGSLGEGRAVRVRGEEEISVLR